MRAIDIGHVPIETILAIFAEGRWREAKAAFHIDCAVRAGATTLGEIFEPVRRTPWRPLGFTEHDFTAGAALAVRHGLVDVVEPLERRFVGLPILLDRQANAEIRPVALDELAAVA